MALGILLCCLSVLYKPLSVAACLALGISLVVVPEQRWKIPWAAATAILVVAVAWGTFHVMSDGVFTDMITLQASRYASKRGFGVMMQYEPFQKIAAAQGVSTPFGWNLKEHRTTFFVMPFLNGNFWLLLLAIGGLVEVLGSAPRVLRAWRRMGRALDARPDLVVLVDSPDFNLPLARRAHAATLRRWPL